MSHSPKLAQRHPVRFVASELAVDRMALQRRLKTAGVDYSKGILFREAFEVLTAKADRDADRDRQRKAEADTAEITAAEKRGTLMLKSDAAAMWADVTIEVRRVIQSRKEWDSAKLLVELAKLKPDS